MTKKRIIILVIIVIVLIGLMGVLKNPRVRLLSSIIHFSESTLNNKEYLLYDIDIMEVFSDYINSDTQITGKMGLPEVKGLSASMSVELDAIRSFSQKKYRSESELNLLWIGAGKLNIYAEDKTWYLTAPLLGEEIGCAFPTDLNWFAKMPELTSDIDREWFRDNYTNIIELMSKIEIEEIDKLLVDEDGTKSDGFKITIHEGDGHFIWELLGMEEPANDVEVIMYLTKSNNFRRMELDLSKRVPGAKLILDGENATTCIFTYELPEGESMEMIMKRNPDAINWIDLTNNYYGNNDKTYTIKSGLNWKLIDDGFEMNLKDMEVTCNDEVLAKGYFLGEVIKITPPEDVFEGKSEELYALEEIKWREVRNDTHAFVQDILDEISIPSLRK